MNCELNQTLVRRLPDGELELTRQLDLEAHLAARSTCKNAAEEAVNLGSLVWVNMPVYNWHLPELKARIQASLRKESGFQLEWVFFPPTFGLRCGDSGVEPLSHLGLDRGFSRERSRTDC